MKKQTIRSRYLSVGCFSVHSYFWTYSADHGDVNGHITQLGREDDTHKQMGEFHRFLPLQYFLNFKSFRNSQSGPRGIFKKKAFYVRHLYEFFRK